MEYGLQLYSVRDISKNDLKDTLLRVSLLGYRFVEFAGFFGHSAENVKKWLEESRLEVSGTHTDKKELEKDRIDSTIAYHQAIGNRNIIIPGADLSSREKLDAFIELLNEAQPKLEKAGIKLGYHNHSAEFIPTSYGAVIHEELEKKTSVDFEIDTYWVYAAKKDPIELIDKLSHRISVIHLKDGFADGKGMALGEGTAPVEAVLRHAVKLGKKIVVESESLTPDGISEVGRCMNYLKKLEL